MFLQQWTLHYTSDKNFMTSTLVINENIWHLDLETMVYIYVELMDSTKHSLVCIKQWQETIIFKDEFYAQKILKINESWNIKFEL